MPINHLGECCNQINIQSDGPTKGFREIGYYEQNGINRNVYKSIFDTGYSLFKDSNDGRWRVCLNLKCSLLQYLITMLFE